MEKIKLSYNTYNKKYIVLKNNEEISANDSWLYKKNQELELWVNGFAKRLFDYINDDISLTFKGYEEDYELLQKEIEIFNSSQKDGYIELNFDKLKETEISAAGYNIYKTDSGTTKKILIEYNPYKLEYTFELNGKTIDKSSKLYENNGKILQLWVNGLTQMLYDVVNDDFKLEFKGTALDYLDLKEDVDNFNNSNNGGHVELYHNEAKSSEDRLKDLRELFNYMQETSPFDDLREERVRVNFEKAMGSEFEVAVIATMSSGKSTLLNALLGRELMPSKNEACTATIARIKDVDGAYGFNAKCLDENENIVVEEVKNVSADTMSSFNENESVSYIDVEGDIPFVESHDIQLVLLDTPGPNTRDHKHREKIYSLINESDSLVLYVLNTTQLSTNDDNALLDAVGDAMNQGGKQAKDRFMFVVNKVDCLDPDKGESVEKVLTNVKDYLKYHGIKNPNIYLASSETAKVIRLHKNFYELSRKQRQTYSGLDLFIDEEELHLEKYAPLSRLGKNKLTEALSNAKSEEDIALIHTGIPAIEIAINEYMERYVMYEKISEVVNTFIELLRHKELEYQLHNALLNDEQQIMWFNDSIERISSDIKYSTNTEYISEKLNELKELTLMRENLERNIEQNKRNKYWLSYVINVLNNILEI
ncbi:dynamin family protein [Brachyspira intermedia]|uniref:dynamin family protein n=1 Tax=Brachyspira intermedia TaxID=84377 RepID=UPI003003CEA7